MVLVSFDVGSERLVLSVRSHSALSDDQWHRVEVEKNIKEAVLQLDGVHRDVRAVPPQRHRKQDFYTDLYVGKQQTDPAQSSLFTESRTAMNGPCCLTKTTEVKTESESVYSSVRLQKFSPILFVLWS